MVESNLSNSPEHENAARSCESCGDAASDRAPSAVVELPVGYDPTEDSGKAAIEPFLNWEDPPINITIDRRRSDGRLLAIAEGGKP